MQSEGVIGHSRLWLALLTGISFMGAVAPAQAQMTTTGTFAVDEAGAASFSVPIVVSPGTGGVEPALTLSYSSQSGNGALGMGWSLNGLSVITRCPQNLAQDGVRGVIKYDENDRFCMDGQRLVGWEGGYGQNGATYRTEIDSFAKITSLGSTGNATGPTSFQVKTKSGLTLEFGNTSDSKILAPGSTAIRVWALNRITDTTGNYLRISYKNPSSSGEYYPDRIEYTGNPNTSPPRATYASVRFDYEDRQDPIKAYDNGALVSTTKRLASVKSYYEETVVAAYKLTYEEGPTTKISRIKTIERCDGAGMCLPPVTLIWSGGQMLSDIWNFKVTDGVTNGSPVDTFLQLGDITGDGLLDIVKYRPSPSGQLTAYRNKGDLTFAGPQGRNIISGGDLQTRSFVLVDINGDMKNDVFVYDPVGGVINVSLSNGDGTFGNSIQTSFKTAPTTVYFQNGGEAGSPSYTEYTVRPFFLDFNDYNADGKVDVSLVIPGICGAGPGTAAKTWLLYGTGAGAFDNGQGGLDPVDQNFKLCNAYKTGPFTFPNPPSINSTTVLESLIFSDFNKDGIIDRTAFYWTQGNHEGVKTYCIYKFDGASSSGITNPAQFFAVDSIGNFVCGGTESFTADQVYVSPGLDVNGDGVMDYVSVLEHQYSSVWTGIGKGDGTFLRQSSVVDTASLIFPWYFSSSFTWNTAGDFNGDGLIDLIGYADQHSEFTSTSVLVAFGLRDGTFRASLSDGLGVLGGCDVREDDFIVVPELSHWSDYADLNGDSLADCFMYELSSPSIVVVPSLGESPDRVLSFADGLGGGVSVIYGTLTDDAVYVKGTGAATPKLDMEMPSQVVREIALSDGLGGVRTTRYRYGSLRAELFGRGLLGFGWMEELQVESDALTRTTYSQDWPYIGMVTKKTLSLPATPGAGARVLMQDVTTTNMCLMTLAPGALPTECPVDASAITYPKVYFPYSYRIVEKAWDLDGVQIPMVTTTTEYDAFGNVAMMKVAASDGYSKRTENTYFNDTARWLLGRLTATTVTAVAPDATP